MDATPLYQQIVAAIRQQIVSGERAPGEALPSVRDLASTWECTPGTVQRAYRQLQREGLIHTQAGLGTRVASAGPRPVMPGSPLRQAQLIHRTEAFLLPLLSLGYSTEEVERALLAVLDRWRTLTETPPERQSDSIRFAGSHDPALSLLAARFSAQEAQVDLQVRFTGSLGGLIALARGEADLAGSHLWDGRGNSYNVATVQRILPGQRVALVTLAERRLGLLVPAGNPAGIETLSDIAQPHITFINRQSGSGTRVWLDAQLHQHQIDPADIQGYAHAVGTHSEVGTAVAEGAADVGLGIETIARSLGLAFIPLTTERYDLVIPQATWSHPGVKRWLEWLASAEAKDLIASLGGYVTSETGKVRWLA